MTFPFPFALASGYRPGAVNFDGTNDYMSRGASLTGAADGKKGIFSCWAKFTGKDGTSQGFFGNPGGFIAIYKDAANKINISGSSSAPAEVLHMTSTSAYTTSSPYIHILMSWDLSAAAGHLYISDVNDLAGGATLTNANIDQTHTDWFIGADGTGGTNRLNADVSEFYLNLAEYLDLSVSSNRAKFISNGRPVSLGSTGTLPTGNQPIIYLKHTTGSSANDFATNLGSGGNFTITGVLTESTSTP